MKVDAETQTAIDDVIRSAGERVKAERKNQRLSRRELSERSGVSPRYLAQLENGTGNISIGLLKSVAIALGLPIVKLLDDGDGFGHVAGSGYTHDIERVISLYQKSDAATRAQILAILEPENRRDEKAERICLIGLRGAGKSTLGSMLSAQFDLKFIELNLLIEEKAGMPTAEILALYGQEGYRTFEAEALADVTNTHQRVVLAAAGGIVDDQETFSRLLSKFHTVWLKASPEEHMERVRAQGDHRPMHGRPEAMHQLKQILEDREQYYIQAEYDLDTAHKTEKDSLIELAALLTSHQIIASTS